MSKTRIVMRPSNLKGLTSMHAILITADNMPEILKAETPQDYVQSCHTLIPHFKRWFLVQGYTMHSGKYLGWTILPGYIVDQMFEHDPAKIKTNWDQIVRK